MLFQVALAKVFDLLVGQPAFEQAGELRLHYFLRLGGVLWRADGEGQHLSHCVLIVDLDHRARSVRKAALVPQSRHQSRARAGAEDVVHKAQHRVVRIVVTHGEAGSPSDHRHLLVRRVNGLRLGCNHEVLLAEPFVRLFGKPVSEATLDELHQLVRIEVTYHADSQMAGADEPRMQIADLLNLDTGQLIGLFCQRGLIARVVLRVGREGAAQLREHEGLRIRLHPLEVGQPLPLQGLELFCGQPRRAHDVGEELDRGREVFSRRLQIRSDEAGAATEVHLGLDPIELVADCLVVALSRPAHHQRR